MWGRHCDEGVGIRTRTENKASLAWQAARTRGSVWTGNVTHELPNNQEPIDDHMNLKADFGGRVHAVATTLVEGRSDGERPEYP